MSIIDIDKRTNEDIIAELERRAASYTPEWRFDKDNPDIGSALAIVYADMFSKTIKKFNQVPFKNQVEFFNELNAKLLPADPAKGYVCLGLASEDIAGDEIVQGTTVLADSDDPDIGKIQYKITEDVYVTPSKISCMYETCDSSDYISCLSEEGSNLECTLFGMQSNNLQEHIMYFSHDDALNIKENSWIELDFIIRGSKVSESILKHMIDDRYAQFSYFTEDGFVDFKRKQVVDGHILLLKEESLPSFAKTTINDTEGFFIRCIINQMKPFKKFEFEKMLISTKGIAIEPESIYGNDVECKNKDYFPFGEKISLYNEVYFASEEAIGKKGALIELAFNVDYVKVPLDFVVENDPVKWKWIMQKDRFKPNYEYDLTIEEVAWEYYNGNGWARLEDLDNGSKIFNIDGDNVIGQYKKLRFVCPKDIQPVLINSCQSYYIRARILKINNMYKLNGNYLSPVLNNTSFSYNYAGNMQLPHNIILKNNMDVDIKDFASISANKAIVPFFGSDISNEAVYLGFEKPPIGAPIKLLFILKDSVNRQGFNLAWQYVDENGRFKDINVVDETDSMSKTGIVSLVINKDISRKKLFGKDLFWIRIFDSENYFDREETIKELPNILGIYINATKIVNNDVEAIEYFRMEIYQENVGFKLSHNKVNNISVYVNEIGNLSKKETEELRKQRRIKFDINESGVTKAAWVRWQQVDEFLFSKPEDRNYILDPNEGVITFGNGINGRIPSASQEENIKVVYNCGGGEYTNLAPYKIDSLGSSIGFINKVYNPMILTGGCGRESLNDALVRNAALVRTQNKAVTVRDYEELALCASRNIETVKCFTGIDGKGKPLLGAVTLVILQKDFEQGRMQFNVVKSSVVDYLSDKICDSIYLNNKLFVVEPRYIKMSVRVEVVVKSFNDVFNVKKDVTNRIEHFLNPLVGNFHSNGWKIGEMPNSIQISNAINDIDGVRFIKKVYISTFIREDSDFHEIEVENAMKEKFALPISGEHEVLISVE